MAKQYVEKLERLIASQGIARETGSTLEIKHFFGGAALYAGGKICASWSPVGLAFKLAPEEVEKLIQSGRAQPLQYFDKGHVKKGYALFPEPETSKPKRWKTYFVRAIKECAAR